MRSAALESDARRAVVRIDDAAAKKAVAGKDVLHRQVVRVGVAAQRRILQGALIRTPADAEIGKPRDASGGGEAVDRAVNAVIFPAAVLDMGIGGIVSDTKHENGFDEAVFFTYKKPVQRDVIFQNSPVGITVYPLGRIALLSHKGTGVFINGEDLRQVGKPRGLNVHGESPFWVWF